jgi:hypothetical protein
MVHKYLSVLLLCSVPLIGMEYPPEHYWKDWTSKTEEEQNFLRLYLEDKDKFYEEKSKIDAGLNSWIEMCGRYDDSKREMTSNIETMYKEKKLAPSQVSPCLDEIETYPKKTDSFLGEYVRKFMGLFRSNL